MKMCSVCGISRAIYERLYGGKGEPVHFCKMCNTIYPVEPTDTQQLIPPPVVVFCSICKAPNPLFKDGKGGHFCPNCHELHRQEAQVTLQCSICGKATNELSTKVTINPGDVPDNDLACPDCL